MWLISTRVNAPENDDPALLDQVDEVIFDQKMARRSNPHRYSAPVQDSALSSLRALASKCLKRSQEPTSASALSVSANDPKQTFRALLITGRVGLPRAPGDLRLNRRGQVGGHLSR
jgi:hypothetical protein